MNPEKEIFMPKQEKAKSSQEKSDLTPYRAQRIFENRVIDTINEELNADQKVTSMNKAVLKWVVDEKTPEGRFSIINHEDQKTPDNKETKRYVEEKDPETGEITKVEKMTGPVNPGEETVLAYDLDNHEVKKIFNQLESAVKETFIRGWQDSYLENKALVEKFKQALKREMRRNEKKELEANITEHEIAQEKIEKMLNALK